jgi:hypothetical protein
MTKLKGGWNWRKIIFDKLFQIKQIVIKRKWTKFEWENKLKTLKIKGLFMKIKEEKENKRKKDLELNTILTYILYTYRIYI